MKALASWPTHTSREVPYFSPRHMSEVWFRYPQSCGVWLMWLPSVVTLGTPHTGSGKAGAGRSPAGRAPASHGSAARAYETVPEVWLPPCT